MASLVSSRRWLQCFSRKYNQTRSTGLISELVNLSASRTRIPFGSAAGYRAGHG
jgi:hypothetical protein